MKSKNIAILIVLIVCCITVAPLIILLLNAMCEGWDYCVLGKMIGELEN